MLLLDVLIFLTSFPIGFLIARLASDELKSGRKYFFYLVSFSLFGILVSLFFKQFYISWTFGFIVVVVLISLKYNKKD